METTGNPQHTTVIGGEEDHHEKTSVFSRVKNKARKIKDSLTKRGNGHDHEEEDDDEETEEAAEIHGAPMHESRREEGDVIDGKSQASRENYSAKNESPEAFRGGDESFGKSRVQTGQLSPLVEDPHYPITERGEKKAAPGKYETKVSDPTRPVRREEGDVIDGKSQASRENYTVKNEGRGAFSSGDEIFEKSRVQIENLSPMEEDPHSPMMAAPENYDTKVSDHTPSGYESRRGEGNVIDGKSQASRENYTVKNEGSEAFRGGDGISEKSRVQVENLSPLEDDSHFPKMGREEEKAALGNYESKVSDPTRSEYESRREEADVIDGNSPASRKNYTVKNESPEAFRGGDEISEKSRVQIENLSPFEKDPQSPKMGGGEKVALENYGTEVSDPTHSEYESRRDEGTVIDGKSQASRENYTVKNEGPEAFRGGDEISEKSWVQIENSSPLEEDSHYPKMGREDEKAAPRNYESKVSDPTRSVYESRREEGDVINGNSHASSKNYTVKYEGPEAFRGGDEISGKSRVQIDNLSPFEKDPQSPKMGRGEKAALENYGTEVYNPIDSVYESRREEGDIIDEKSQASRENYTVENEGRDAFRRGDEIPGKSKVQIGKLSPLVEDPHSPITGRGVAPGNYETKVSDPTRSGGNEAGVEPLARDFGAMKVSDDPHPTSAGSHDQFSPEDNPNSPEKPQSYASTIYSASISAKNVVASKLGYGQGTETGAPDTEEKNQEKEAGDTPSSATYSQKIMGTITPVYGKVAEAGSAVVAKIQGSGKGEVKIDETEGGVKRSSKGVPVSEFVAQKLRPGEEDKALSEVITDSIHKRKEQSEGQHEEAAPAAVSPGMVNRIKGAVTSMFSKGGAETPPSPQSHPSQYPSGERGEVGADKEAHGAT